MYELLYCNVCTLYTVCSGVVCCYAASCHHHGCPRSKWHISAQLNIHVGSEGGASHRVQGRDFCTSFIWSMYISPTHISNMLLL